MRDNASFEVSIDAVGASIMQFDCSLKSSDIALNAKYDTDILSFSILLFRKPKEGRPYYLPSDCLSLITFFGLRCLHSRLHYYRYLKWKDSMVSLMVSLEIRPNYPQ